MDMKPCCREVEIRVQIRHVASQQDGAYVNQQEGAQVATRQSLQPGDAALPLPPASFHEHEPGQCLEGKKGKQ